ncbi:MAG: hypothetical protein IT585_02805 [candidate division Zixibacteria bacterium]|nr:hypothetical protein [candidate division Zixibacteria bacterium]
MVGHKRCSARVATEQESGLRIGARIHRADHTRATTFSQVRSRGGGQRLSNLALINALKISEEALGFIAATIVNEIVNRHYPTQQPIVGVVGAEQLPVAVFPEGIAIGVKFATNLAQERRNPIAIVPVDLPWELKEPVQLFSTRNFTDCNSHEG